MLLHLNINIFNDCIRVDDQNIWKSNLGCLSLFFYDVECRPINALRFSGVFVFAPARPVSALAPGATHRRRAEERRPGHLLHQQPAEVRLGGRGRHSREAETSSEHTQDG